VVSIRKTYISYFILIVLGIFLLSYGLRIRNSSRLKNKVINTIKQSETINFSEVTDFDWDKLYIIQPYSDVNTLLKKDRINSPNKDYAIKLSDSIYMIAFIDENKLIQFIDLPMEYITLIKNMDNPIKFGRNDSKFSISEKRIVIK
jgi:hypothetical protein